MRTDPVSVPPRIRAAFEETWADLADGGTWWTATEQLGLAEIARAAFSERSLPRWMRPITDAAVSATPELDPAAASAMVTLAADARSIDRQWAADTVERIGDAAYVELVAIAATMAAVDAFAEAIGSDPTPLPRLASNAAAPTRTRPDGMGDASAYVEMAVPWSDANVARALTLSPSGNALYRRVGVALYHEGQFLDLDWNRPISRPQAELIATTVSAASECFY